MLALASLAFVGCSKDEITEVNQGDPIDFAVTSAKATRVVDTTTNSINEVGSKFKVWAYTTEDTPQTFMNGLTATKESAGWNYGPLKFWPNTTNLKFYAVHPIDINVTMSAASQTIENYVVSNTLSEQKDLLYATNLGDATYDANGETVLSTAGLGKQSAAVPINFRHALSKIVFAAKVTHANLEVDINGVEIVNIKSKNTFTYPKASTLDHLGDEDKNLDTETNATWGTWATPSAPLTYAAGITEVKGITSGSGTKTLTTSTNAVADDPNTEANEAIAATTPGALLLLPQTIEALDFSKNTIGGTSNVDPNATTQTKPYFLVSCKIKDSGVYLWGSAAEYKKVAIPVSTTNFTWKQGKKYTYTFVFGSGGGYDPENGDPVLVPITFTVTVDAFQSAPNIDVNM